MVPNNGWNIFHNWHITTRKTSKKNLSLIITWHPVLTLINNFERCYGPLCNVIFICILNDVKKNYEMNVIQIICMALKAELKNEINSILCVWWAIWWWNIVEIYKTNFSGHVLRAIAIGYLQGNATFIVAKHDWGLNDEIWGWAHPCIHKSLVGFLKMRYIWMI